MNNKYNIIEVVESEVIANNPVFKPNTIITFFNNSSKFKLADGKTAFNSLSFIGGEGITSDTQTALNLKANINSPTFTGTVSGITKVMVGLNLVDNTSDLSKPISTATQTALDTKLTATTAAFDAKLTATTSAFNAKLTANQVASQPASVAATLAALVTDFNNLITAMKTSGVMIT